MLDYLQIHEEYLNGAKLKNLALKYNISDETLRVNFNKLNLPKKSQKTFTTEILNDLNREYLNSTLSLKQFCKNKNLSYGYIHRVFKQTSLTVIPTPIRPSTLSLKDVEGIKEMVLQRKTLSHIAETFKVSKQTIRRSFEKYKVDYTMTKNISVLAKDPNFFKEIDSEIKAYMLGLLYSDGSISKGGDVYISLQEEDTKVVELFKEFLGGNIVKIERRKPTHKDQIKWYLGCKLLVEDLMSHGLMVNKSHKEMIMPILRDDLNRHFIRGFFDGDGSIYKSVRNIKIKFFCTSQTFLKGIADFIKGDYYWDKNGTVHVLMYGNVEDRLRIKDLFYKNSNYWMIRKKDKFDMYVNSVLNNESNKSLSV